MPIQAILVRFHGPSQFRGSRVTAMCQAKTITKSRVYELNDYANAQKIVSELCKTLDWHGKLHCGITRLGEYVFVFETNEDNSMSV